ncbi:hypothetical protein Cha6605_1427 [Chamaesiphon minutus PCC 6605]|uniref:Uncharacterized protein n=1 Tax=Chamaesiphon minutus (strain ATCC 27169 / PCC 6605) TaxID=1173020 RepID=K9UEH2_CHAP6|nr:hypothetical protein Cha6605_1427 [Chamaesiphon minutus PCC 6605]
MRSLQALSQKVLKLYLAIDSLIVEIFDKSLCRKGLGLCFRESDRRGLLPGFNLLRLEHDRLDTDNLHLTLNVSSTNINILIYTMYD